MIGINTFIQCNNALKLKLNKYINLNKKYLQIDEVIYTIVTNIKEKDTIFSNIIKAFNYKLKLMVLNSVFFDKYKYGYLTINNSTISLFKQMILYNRYYCDDNLPKTVVKYVCRGMIKDINAIINNMRCNSENSSIVGHFIENIITKNTNINIERELRYNYTQHSMDIDLMRKDISVVLRQLSKLLKYNRFKLYLNNSITSIYLDSCYNKGFDIAKIIEISKRFIETVNRSIKNYDYFINLIRGMLCISINDYKDILNTYNNRFKSQIISQNPLLHEIDILTSDKIIEIKTGATEVNKHFRKLLISNKFYKRKTIVIFNIRCCSLIYIEV